MLLLCNNKVLINSFVTSIFLTIGNVVWDDDFSASRVLTTIGKDIQKPIGDLLNHFTVVFI